MIDSLLRLALSTFLLGAGLLAPGWLLGRAVGTSPGATGVFLGSAVILLNLLLGLDALGVPLAAANVSAALALICGALALAARRRPAHAVPRITTITSAAAETHAHAWNHWLLLPAAIGLGAIAVRATTDPLSGFDTLFRWDFLARQILRHGSLDFYPPVSPGEFVRYGWCDGIAPLVSSLYAWSYVALGQLTKIATAPVVFGQGVLLFLTVYQLGTHTAGRGAGLAAVAVLATSPLLLWAVAMGQETGLTALSAAAMFLYIERSDEGRSGAWLVWAGIAAGAGALAREYGLVLVALGAVALVWRGVPWRCAVTFVGSAAVVTLPWYLRNWARTANPLYSHELGGLFPGNPILADYLRTLAELLELRPAGERLAELGVWFSLLTLIPFALAVAAVAGGASIHRRIGPWLLTIVTIAALWSYSVRFTSGGLTYSLRVLTPAIALAAVLAGRAVARLPVGTGRLLAGIALTGAAVDAAQRSLFLPLDPAVRWWRVRASAWQDFGKAAAAVNSHGIWGAVTDAAQAHHVVVSDAYLHAVVTHHGSRAVPLFSPAVRFLFDENADYAACLERLRAGGARFFLLARGNPILDRQLGRYPFFQVLQKAPAAYSTETCSIFDLYSPEVERVGLLAPAAKFVR